MPVDPLIEHERLSKPSKVGLGHAREHRTQPRDTAMMPMNRVVLANPEAIPARSGGTELT